MGRMPWPKRSAWRMGIYLNSIEQVPARNKQLQKLGHKDQPGGNAHRHACQTRRRTRAKHECARSAVKE